MTTLSLVLVAIVAVFLAYTIVGPTLVFLPRYLMRFRLFCPEHRTYGKIGVNSLTAALTAAYSKPKIRVRSCNLRPKHEQCDERCLDEIPN